MDTNQSSTARAWAVIDRENEQDDLLRKVSRWAWTGTFIFVLLFTITYAVLLGYRAAVFGFHRPYVQMELLKAAIPLFASLGVVGILVATLSTIGVFSRSRAATLAEIQLRLAALEDILTGEDRNREEE